MIKIQGVQRTIATQILSQRIWKDKRLNPVINVSLILKYSADSLMLVYGKVNRRGERED